MPALRRAIRELVHSLLPRPGLPLEWGGNRLEPVELPPLHDLHGEVPVRQHHLAAAGGRRGTALQADVIQATVATAANTCASATLRAALACATGSSRRASPRRARPMPVRPS